MFVLFVLSYFYQLFFWVFIGAAFHLILEVIDQTRFHNRMDRVSLIHDIFKYKNLIHVDDVKI